MTQKEAFEMAVLRFIDAYVSLNKTIGAKELTQQFHMHRTGASAIIRRYKDAAPRNLRLNLATKKYEISDTFSNAFLNNVGAEAYLKAVGLVFGPSQKSKEVKC